MRDQFRALTQFLREHEMVWRQKPFQQRSAPWHDRFPEIARWVAQLSEEELDQVEAHPLRSWPAAPRTYDALRQHCLAVTALPETPGRQAIASATLGRARWKVPGRKLAQITRFSEALLDDFRGLGIAVFVEWCAGKGHLGRLLAMSGGCQGILLEQDPHLSRIGESLNRRAGAACDYRLGDVRETTCNLELPGAWALLSLHGCGYLTDELLRVGVERRTALIACAGCCYHVVDGGEARPPLSREGTALDLPLDRAALRLAVSDEVVAPARERRHRRREMAWRLGADDLLREIHRDDRYHSLGNLDTAVKRLNFNEFCRYVARSEGVQIPGAWNPDRAEQQAWSQTLAVRRLALLRALFRRPIECWIAFDRLMYLQEQGREATASLFCGASETPRNILLLAR